MNLRRNLIVTLVVFALGCTVPGEANDNDWELSEPHEESESVEQAEPDEPTEEVEEPEGPGEPDVVECPGSDGEEWEPEDFAFSMYRQLACERDAGENIVFSPAGMRLALSEWAKNADAPYGELLAERLGYGDLGEMIAESEAYREELLDRKPVPSEGMILRQLREYWFEEDDVDELQRALGVELYGIDCSGGDETPECMWVGYDKPWEESYLDDEDLSVEDDGAVKTHGIALRGQWEAQKRPSYRKNHTFIRVNGTPMKTYRVSGKIDYYGQTEGLEIFGWRLVGGEVSLLVMRQSDESISISMPELAALESKLSAKTLETWIDAFERKSGRRSDPELIVPKFDIGEVATATDLFDFDVPVATATQVGLDSQGINSPESIELICDHDGSPVSGAGIGFERNRFDSPFIFVVYDHPTESILKMGRVAHP